MIQGFDQKIFQYWSNFLYIGFHHFKSEDDQICVFQTNQCNLFENATTCCKIMWKKFVWLLLPPWFLNILNSFKWLESWNGSSKVFCTFTTSGLCLTLFAGFDAFFFLLQTFIELQNNSGTKSLNTVSLVKKVTQFEIWIALKCIEF